MLYDKASDLLREKPEIEEDDVGRSAFRRDYGRLLHSPSFRRLQGKTQLFPGNESDFFRNRLTHSLEVAQIAKGIAQILNTTKPELENDPIDLDLVEFAGLAHDLGHPPFGHNGERALDDCMKKNGGFEGNAQTLRILSCVEKKKLRDTDGKDADVCGISADGHDRRLGLNLSYRSLASVLKYDQQIPLRRDEGASLVKGYYASENSLVQRIKEHVGNPPAPGAFKTIECQIMDIADDIAYSSYDLEDAMKGGFAHPLQLRAQVLGGQSLIAKKLLEKLKREISNITELDLFNAIDDLLNLDEMDSRGASSSLGSYETSKLVASDGMTRCAFFSDLVGKFMHGVGAEMQPGKDVRFSKIIVERGIRIKIETLKHLSYLLTIMSPRLKVVEYRGYEVVKTIFDTLDSEEGHLLLPDDLQLMYERLKDTGSRRRLICDFVAGMTDRYAVEFYSRLRESGASIFKPL
ncbi:dNTP triphosphohydrolase [Verminephrobacter aporrectodeae subsp. tuberculatae]|uniref:dGTP triphosphohydrolase n=1 Tax=Verminephrobacter aporrectodeae TaxID=1110389 RepID=UPI002243D8DC|nr:dNTP triphosphohydrolase [Verminephrobacter aporrectodeae]MCW8199533.1 dNTP triphosphohydrolase [Verminephrobacter aporrectodeae subsp. tuberculatae]